jgi:hypothetical protein
MLPVTVPAVVWPQLPELVTVVPTALSEAETRPVTDGVQAFVSAGTSRVAGWTQALPALKAAPQPPVVPSGEQAQVAPWPPQAQPAHVR